MSFKKFLIKIAKKNFVELKIEEVNGKTKVELSDYGKNQLAQLMIISVMIAVSERAKGTLHFHSIF